MITEKKLANAYLEWFGNNTYAITFVFNRNVVSRIDGGDRLREFHRLVDQKRLGGRYYRYPETYRLRFRVVPEQWDVNPHFHGLIRLPSDDLDRLGFEALVLEYQEIWERVAPGGSLDIRPLWEPEAWVKYCSKEHLLSDGEFAIDSLVNGCKSPWIVQVSR